MPVTVQTALPGTAPGLLFITPQALEPQYQRGLQIRDNQGRLVYFRDIGDSFATDFQVQTYRGEPVLTWWEGAADNTGLGTGVGYIADENYKIIATVRGTEPLDLHEFLLTPQGTALVMVVRFTPYDLTPYGGPADAKVVDNGYQEIDVATGEIVHEWWALDHVPVSDTDMPTATGVLDFIHMNSVGLDADGDVLISGRHTSTVYKVDRQTGEIIWRLGGRQSDFTFAEGEAPFQWQHDARGEGANTYRIFDNAVMPPEQGESKVVWVKVDPGDKTAKLVRDLTHPAAPTVFAEGGSQRLPHGNTIVSWGTASRISEFTADGTLVYDATLPTRHSTYRAYRFPWHARPSDGPTITVDEAAGTAHAIWNGATDVAKWRVLDGTQPVAEVAWDGYDTTIDLPGTVNDAEVQALDAHGRVLGSSDLTDGS